MDRGNNGLVVIDSKTGGTFIDHEARVWAEWAGWAHDVDKWYPLTGHVSISGPTLKVMAVFKEMERTIITRPQLGELRRAIQGHECHRQEVPVRWQRERQRQQVPHEQYHENKSENLCLFSNVRENLTMVTTQSARWALRQPAATGRTGIE